jgi:hypothetical protein
VLWLGKTNDINTEARENSKDSTETNILILGHLLATVHEKT